MFDNFHAASPIMCSGMRSAAGGNYSLTYEVSGDSITFTLQAQTTTWVALGFSLDQFMVSHCIQVNVF